jgi:hypothetical protein
MNHIFTKTSFNLLYAFTNVMQVLDITTEQQDSKLWYTAVDKWSMGKLWSELDV